LLVGFGCSSNAAAPPPSAKADATKNKRDVVTEEHFSVKVEDPFRWLEDEKDEDVRAWMKARDDHARSVLATFPERDALQARYRELLYVESRSAPRVRGGRLFFARKPADREKTIHYWQQGEGGEPKVLLDPNTMSEDGSVSIGAVVPSKDGKLVAYMEKSNNADESTLKIMEVDTGALRERDTIEHLRYTYPSWTPDGAGFYYTWLPSDPSIPSNERMGLSQVRYHALGTDPANDVTVRGETGDAQRWQGAYVSDDGKYLFLTISHGWSEADVYVMFLEEEEPTWRPLAVGTKALYGVVAHDDVFYVTTNYEAPRYEVFRVLPSKLERKHWRRIVAQDPKAVIEDVDVVGGKLAIAYLKDVSTTLEIRELDGTKIRDVELPAIGTASALIGDADHDTAYFSFSSFNYAPTIYKTSIAKGTTTLFAKVDLPLDSERFVVKRVEYPSKDGTMISMFLVHDKDLELDGARPTLMYGYGGFNISITPEFTAFILPWIERGGVYASPHLRGGGEYGESWHKAGMLEKKQNVFDDFAAAAEWLVAEKYTSPEHLGIRGGSNGGLLVGAAMTQRPELFGAVICAVPLLDMLRYHLFGVGKAWIPEYGVADDEAQFAVLHAYSPYHHVKADVAYPPLLMLSADTDDRVDPMHARKFVAALEAVTPPEHVHLLRIEENAGHGGADLRKKTVEVYVDQVAFLLEHLR
jgi:prolyl oligopeptidase